ncbi:MAG: SulP family inorganic anion transporter [Candidatus Omnitrophica bacterium]|nr:SulP family inorganic anion transporter [Candidatus Omnitrophota bacterium]
MFKPKLFTTLKGYSLDQFRTDVVSGVIVGIVALPLAIAFAIASGVAPDRGLITAVIAGFLISFLGGSRVQIGGPTGAFVVIVYSIVQKYGIDGLLVATLMGGIIMIIFGVIGLGGVIKFIPRPVTVGFTSGIAVLIFSSQIKDFFGLSITKLPSEFIEKCISYFKNFHTINYNALFVGAITIAIILLWQRFIKKIPGSIVAMIIVTSLVYFLKLPVTTIGSAFGEIPNKLPMPGLPHITLRMIQDLMAPAFTIALLASIESLLSAVVADGMIGGKHRSNMELVAQGISNIASSLFGGMPATGAIARTAVNVHNGGRTPVAGMVHALTLFLIMVLFGKLAKLVPLACLSGILIIVAFRIAEWNTFRSILKAPKSDILVLFATFLLTVFVDLTVAIQIGMVMASFLLIYRLSKTANIKNITKDMEDEEETSDDHSISKCDVPSGVEVFEVQGPFFFGTISSFIEAVEIIEKPPKIRIIRMRNVLSIDDTALNALRQTYQLCKKHKIIFMLSGVHAQPLFALERSGLLKDIGEDHIFCNIDEALNSARKILAELTWKISKPNINSTNYH